MDSESPPPAPEAPPRIPPGPLWLCLLMPSIITILSTFSALGMGNSSPDFAVMMLFAGPLSGLVCGVWFYRMMKVRYRGRSLVLMTIGYIFGQLVITPAVLFGACLVAVNSMNL